MPDLAPGDRGFGGVVGAFTSWSFGQVALHGLHGSYTDTYSGAPGWVELRPTGASTFDGRWGEDRAGKRFGTLELTAWGDGRTLTGLWSADPACEVRPRKPEREPLRWVRLDPPAR